MDRQAITEFFENKGNYDGGLMNEIRRDSEEEFWYKRPVNKVLEDDIAKDYKDLIGTYNLESIEISDENIYIDHSSLDISHGKIMFNLKEGAFSNVKTYEDYSIVMKESGFDANSLSEELGFPSKEDFEDELPSLDDYLKIETEIGDLRSITLYNELDDFVDKFEVHLAGRFNDFTEQYIDERFEELENEILEQYNVKDSELIMSYWNGVPSSNFDYKHEELYINKDGDFFLNGRGGAMTDYSIKIDNNHWSGGSRIIPMTDKEAYEWVSEFKFKNLEPEEQVQILKHFPEYQKDKDACVIAVSSKPEAIEYVDEEIKDAVLAKALKTLDKEKGCELEM